VWEERNWQNGEKTMATVEISAHELVVLKKLVLVNAALAEALSDPTAVREQLAMVRVLNELVVKADLAIQTARDVVA
jgi:hypothetical protein